MADPRLTGYAAAVLICAADRATKWIVETRVSFTDTYKIIPGFFDIVRSQNRGVAFGLFNDSSSEWRTLLLRLFSLAAVAALAAVLWWPARLDRRGYWAFVVILGGAAGNVYDRLMYGQVTDFLELYIGPYHWPTFNLADSAIVIGCGLLLLDILKPRGQAAGA